MYHVWSAFTYRIYGKGYPGLNSIRLFRFPVQYVKEKGWIRLDGKGDNSSCFSKQFLYMHPSRIFLTDTGEFVSLIFFLALQARMRTSAMFLLLSGALFFPSLPDPPAPISTDRRWEKSVRATIKSFFLGWYAIMTLSNKKDWTRNMLTLRVGEARTPVKLYCHLRPWYRFPLISCLLNPYHWKRT